MENKNKILDVLYFPISVIYGVIVDIRNFLYDLNFIKKTGLKIPVISIGNLSTGGTGKTPLTIDIAKHLINEGLKVAIISRGYKSKKESSTLVVSDGITILNSVEDSGDEPYLIAKSLKKAIVIIGKNRINSSKIAMRLGAEIIILDDGFQHRRIHRNLDIVLIDAKKLGNKKAMSLFPYGELREDIKSLKRANKIFITNYNKLQEIDEYIKKIRIINSNAEIYNFSYKLKKIKGINIKKELELIQIQNLDFLSFSGIANPKRFIALLKKNKINNKTNITFPDHHNYTTEDIKRIIEIAIKNNIENIITTEKDAVKLLYLTESAPVTFWHTEIDISHNNIEKYQELINSIIKMKK